MKKIITYSKSNTKSRKMEYKAFNEETQKWIFQKKYTGYCTQNISDFISIVHALHYCNENSLDSPIYNNNKIAINWANNKKTNTQLFKNNENKEIFQLYENALVWLKQNECSNQILFWNKKEMGNIEKPFYKNASKKNLV